MIFGLLESNGLEWCDFYYIPRSFKGFLLNTETQKIRCVFIKKV